MSSQTPAPNGSTSSPKSSTSARGRRRGHPLVVLVVVVVLLAALVVAADFVVRSYAEGQVSKQIQSSLPAGSTGSVDATIGGFSAIAQLAKGRFDELDLRSHDLVVGGTPLSATARIDDVPLSEGGTTGDVDATITIDQSAINDLDAVKRLGTLRLGDDRVSLDKTLTVLGLKVSGTITGSVAPSGSGTRVAFTPTETDLKSGLIQLSPSAILQYAKTLDLSVCAAQYLPKGATVSKIVVAPKTARISVHTDSLALTDSTFETTGSCS